MPLLIRYVYFFWSLVCNIINIYYVIHNSTCVHIYVICESLFLRRRLLFFFFCVWRPIYFIKRKRSKWQHAFFLHQTKPDLTDASWENGRKRDFFLVRMISVNIHSAKEFEWVNVIIILVVWCWLCSFVCSFLILTFRDLCFFYVPGRVSPVQ